MGRTLKDLFRGSDKDTERRSNSSRLRVETTGLRVSEFLPSIPTLYGSETIRITDQRTSLPTEMRSSRGLENDGGLVGDGIDTLTGGRASSLTELGNFAEDKLGLPKSLTPTRVISKSEFSDGKEQDTMITLAEIRNDATGTQLGRFLKQSGGGTPSQIVGQGLGNLLNVGKDFARNLILGSRPELNPNEPSNSNESGIRTVYNSGDESYSILMRDFRLPDETKSLIPSDADDRLPENYVRNFTYLNRLPKRGESRGRDYYTENQFRDSTDDMVSKRGRSSRMVFSKADNDETPDYTLDSILFKIGDIRFNTVAVTGLSESFSPTWDGSQMIGNPFSQYTYSGISRSVDFSLKLYSMNSEEHKENWSKIENLGKLTYPLGFQGETGFVTPPVTTLTIGSLYKGKHGFISSLSYSVDDNTPWDLGFGSSVPSERLMELQDIPVNNVSDTNLDTAGKEWKLPVIIDASISFTFIESRSDIDGVSLYTFEPIT